jgi:hypothetical protein
LQKQVAIDSNNNSPPLMDEPSPSGLGEMCICLLAPFVSTVTWCRLCALLMVADIFMQEEFYAWEESNVQLARKKCKTRRAHVSRCAIWPESQRVCGVKVKISGQTLIFKTAQLLLHEPYQKH